MKKLIQIILPIWCIYSTYYESEFEKFLRTLTKEQVIESKIISHHWAQCADYYTIIYWRD